MNRMLAIETSSEACSLALSVDGEVRTREYHEPRRHAELLLPAVRELLAEGGLELSGLDAIAFGCGPGSFTSLRIGIGAVQGLAWGAELGVVPISSLAALAQGAADREHAAAGTPILAAVDARMSEVFHGAFAVGASGLVEAQSEEQVSPPGAVEVSSAAQMIGAGNGFERYPELGRIGETFASVHADLWPSAVQVIALARAWLESEDPLPAHAAQPVYVRNHVADKPAAH